jgi:hypothetical protein
MSMNGQDLLYAHRDKIADTLFACIKRLLLTSDEQLLSYMREQNNSLIEWLDDENRLLAAAAGEDVPPKVHQVQAVLVGLGSGGTP